MIEHVLFCSYGNDSIALIQWAHEHRLKNVVTLYSDTGWAAPSWENRVKLGEGLARYYGFTTARTTSIGMHALVKHRKGWPRQGMQFCTSELKIKPARGRTMVSFDDLRNRALEGVPGPDGRFERLFTNSRPLMPEHFSARMSCEPTRVVIRKRTQKATADAA